MAGKSVETTIAYKLDARGLRDAKRELEKAFKPDSVKAMNAALNDAKGRVKSLSVEYANVGKAIGASADMPKRLRDNIKAAREEVQRLVADLGKQAEIEQKIQGIKQEQAQLAKVTQARARLAESQAMLAASQMASRQRGSAFRQGLYQGIGGPVSRFMQRRDEALGGGGAGGPAGMSGGAANTAQVRAEMRSQFMGQMIGGAVRGVGAGTMQAGRHIVGAASGMMGGAGPLSSMMGSIPFVGGAAGLAEGAVGSFVERQRAQLGAIPFIGSTKGMVAKANRARAGVLAGGAGDVAQAGVAGRAAYMDDRIGAGTGARARAAAMQEATATEYGKRYGSGADRHDDSGDIFDKIRAGKIGAGTIPGLNAAQRAEIANAARERISEQGVATLGNRAADRAGQIARDEAQKRLDAKANTAANVELNKPFAGMKGAVRGLLTDTEAIQAGTAFTRNVGGQFNKGQFEQAFAAETLSGVDQGTSAALFKQQRAGRGGSSKNERDMLAKAIGAATSMGLEGSEIGEYLDTIASAQADAASRGLKLDTEAITGLGTALAGGLGLQGPQAGRIAGNINQAAQNVVTQGAKGPIDIQMLRAAGFDPAQGNFLETRRKLAGGMDASSTFDLLQNLVGGEGDPLKRGYTLERAGLGLGTEQAITMGDRLKGGKDAFMAQIGGRTGSAADLIAGMDMGKPGSPTALGMLTGGIRGANAVQNQLVAAGGAAAGNVQAMQQQAASLATAMATQLKPTMDVVTKGMGTMSKTLEKILTFVGDMTGAAGDGIPVRILK